MSSIHALNQWHGARHHCALVGFYGCLAVFSGVYGLCGVYAVFMRSGRGTADFKHRLDLNSAEHYMWLQAMGTV